MSQLTQTDEKHTIQRSAVVQTPDPRVPKESDLPNIPLTLFAEEQNASN
jgi:hypothetical protein